MQNQISTASVRSFRALSKFSAAAPHRLRALVRGSEIWLVALALVVGAAGGAVVLIMNAIVYELHHLLFLIEPGERLSSAISVPLASMIVVPVVGGLILAAAYTIVMRARPRRIVDPIEANALHGGQMSFRDSLVVAVQTLISTGFGASVGLEAGFTQMVSAIGSKVGTAFRLRRADLRVLVGCGAAAAIAAAFGAPLAGAFYAFELIIGTYTPAALAPVLAASIMGVIVSRALGGQAGLVDVGAMSAFKNADLPALLLLAFLCAGVGIAIMRSVSLTERLFRRTRLPVAIHPVFGGLIIGGLALIDPHILSSGHGALKLTLNGTLPAITPILLLVVLKSLAAAISLGSGFRGGLFFTSLFLGALVGKAFAAITFAVVPHIAPDPLVATVVGMCGMAVAIVGGPLTMSFLALETTGDVPITLAVLAAAIVSAITVRELFGYSFATWRLHLRGETIRSAHDIGRIRALTVGKLMRRDVRTVRSDMRVAAFRRDFPLGSTQRVVVVDGADRYAGLILVSQLHAIELNGEADLRTIGEFLTFKKDVLEPQMNIKDAMRIFDQSESEALAVIDDPESRKVIGLLSESHALRRYSEELDRARRDLVGEAA
jgi:CIC family chloride channel protein